MPTNLSKLAQGLGTRAVREVVSSAVDTFAPLPVDRGVVDGRNFFVRPVALSDEGPFDFVIPADSEQQYVNLEQMRIIGEISVEPVGTVAADALTDENKTVSLINGFDQAMWRSIEVETNGRLQTALSGAHYAYKAYLETVLSYGREAFETHLAPTFHPPQPVPSAAKDNIESYDNTFADPSFGRRVAEKRHIHFSSPLHADFLLVDRYIPSGVNLRFRFHRNSDDFLIFQKNITEGDNARTPKYAIRVHKLMLMVRKIDIAPNILAEHRKLFARDVMKFPFSRTIIKTFNIEQTARTFNLQGMYRGVLPQQLVHCLVGTRAFNGDSVTNPFYFHHYSMDYYQLYHNGKPVPSLPYQPSFADGSDNLDVLYRDLLDHVGIKNDNAGCIATPQRFRNGSFILVHDLTPDHCATYHPHLSSEGDISLSMSFAAGGLTEGVTLISMAVYNSAYFIKANREVLLDSEMSLS